MIALQTPVFLMLLASLGMAPTAPAASIGTVFPNEALDYSVQWPSGLSLGEAHWKAHNTGSASSPQWEFNLDFDAHLPGYGMSGAYQSAATAAFCTESFSKDLQLGSRKAAETVTVDSQSLTATRTTRNGGGESKLAVPSCVRDGLTFLDEARHELASGRVPANQSVLLGALYYLHLTYLGTQTIKSGDRAVDTDRVGCDITGPSSNVHAEIFFARDAVRTPVLFRIPLSMGTFSVELTH